MSLKPGSILKVNERITNDEYIQSPNGRYFAIMQSDGNFCVYKGSPQDNQGGIWCCNSVSHPAMTYFAIMQADGNFCVYAQNVEGCIWACNSVSYPQIPYFATVLDNGQFCVYKGTSLHDIRGTVWSSPGFDTSVMMSTYRVAMAPDTLIEAINLAKASSSESSMLLSIQQNCSDGSSVYSAKAPIQADQYIYTLTCSGWPASVRPVSCTILFNNPSQSVLSYGPYPIQSSQSAEFDGYIYVADSSPIYAIKHL